MFNPMAMHWCRLYKGTDAEFAMENAVAELGVPYRTQFPGFLYGFRYYPDFFLPTVGIVIEVDDPSHDRAAKIISDAERDEALEARGWRTIRVTNRDALRNPREALRVALVDAGLWPLPRGPELTRSLMPVPKVAAQREKRAAKRAVNAKKRRKKAPSPPPAPVDLPPDPLWDSVS